MEVGKKRKIIKQTDDGKVKRQRMTETKVILRKNEGVRNENGRNDDGGTESGSRGNGEPIGGRKTPKQG